MITELIKTKRLKLIPIEKNDLELLFPLFSKRTIEDFTYMTETTDDMKNWMNEALNQKIRPWKIEFNKKVIGVIDMGLDENDTPGWEVGYFIDYDYQKNGFASEAVSSILKYCIDKHGADNIVAGITIHNAASRKLVEKLGFILKRTVLQDWKWRGKIYDSVYYYLDKNKLNYYEK